MAEVLVIGLSARALSQSARAGGYLPLAADIFCDLDTREACERSVRIESDLDEGLQWEPVVRATERVAAGRAPIGIVCGSGFEDRPALLDRLGERWPLLGNRSDAVARVKDPARLSELCGSLGMQHPRWSAARPGDGWISKRIGGAGGSHIAAAGETRAAGYYWQKRVEGAPVSALVLGAGARAMVLGFSQQWPDPSPDAPYRYGGAVRPAALAAETQAALQDAAIAAAERAGLVGLNSFDFLVNAHGWHLVDVNPRPGATIDIFHPVAGSSLFALHLAACEGRLPAVPPAFEGAAAARIVYAGKAVDSVPEFGWPDWTADRQPPGTRWRAGDPVCTVLARAETPAAARHLAEARGVEIALRLGVDT